MKPAEQVFCHRIWQSRDAYLLRNGLVRQGMLLGGGHIAEFRFREIYCSQVTDKTWNAIYALRTTRQRLQERPIRVYYLKNGNLGSMLGSRLRHNVKIC